MFSQAWLQWFNALYERVVSLPGGSGSGATVVSVTVSGGATINSPGASADGQVYIYFIFQTASPGTVTWQTGGTGPFKYAPRIPVTANTENVVTFYGNSSDGKWHNNGASILGRAA